MPPIEVLPYHPDEDRAAVEAIMRAGLRDQERLAAALTPPEDAGFFDGWWRALEQALEREPEGCWIADEDGQVVGFLWTSVVREWPLPYMVVQQVDVHPDHRNRGIGTKLLEQAIFLARSRPIALVLGGLVNNPSQRLYRRMGFVDLPPGLRQDRERPNPNHFELWWQGK